MSAVTLILGIKDPKQIGSQSEFSLLFSSAQSKLKVALVPYSLRDSDDPIKKEDILFTCCVENQEVNLSEVLFKLKTALEGHVVFTVKNGYYISQSTQKITEANKVPEQYLQQFNKTVFGREVVAST